MGKFYVLIAALMLSVAATAENTTKAKNFIGEGKEKAALLKSMKVAKQQNGGKLLLHDNIVNRKAKANAPVMVNKARRDAALPTEMITEQPAGTLYKNMYRWSYTIGTFWGYIYQTEVDGIADDVVIADDGSFYLKNPLSAVATDTWMKGHKAEGDTIEVEFPQYIYSEDYYGETYDYYLWKLVEKEYEYDGELYADYVPDSLSQVMKFVWRNDSLIKVGDGILGICASDTLWAGYADEEMTLTTFNEPTVAPSANATVETYSITYPYTELVEDNYLVNVAKEGSDLYIGGLHQNMPDAWVKGTLKDGKVTFGAQYMGVDTLTLAHTFFEPAREDSVYVPYIDEDGTDYSYWYVDVALADSITFDYDAATGIMTTDSMMIINQGNKIQNYMASFNGSVLKPWTEKAATPADPEFEEYSEYTEDYGYGYATFLIPAKSTEGEVIDRTKMYYNVYFDDEVATLYPDEYAVTEEMTNIPYDLTDNYAIYTSAAEKTFYFFSTGFEKFGVQSTYTGGGEEHSSNIVYYVNTDEGIKKIDSNEAKAVKSTSYTDLSGRTVKSPSKGLYIKTVKFADGTVKSYKVIANN